MSEALHTPGPWQLCHGGLPGDDGFSIASKISREVVCERWPCTCDNNDRVRMVADSKLIAAAPEMLAFIQEVASDTDGRASGGLIEKARAIIATATGDDQ